MNLNAHIELQRLIDKAEGNEIDMEKAQKYMEKQRKKFDFEEENPYSSNNQQR